MDITLSSIGDKKECEVTYLGHSGWAVKTKNSLLIFDYTRFNSVIKERKVQNAVVDIQKLKEENIYVFVSHEHDDHYDKDILSWSNDVKNIKYIFGWKDEATADYIQVAPNEELRIENVEISTINSTDDGVGYLIIIDGISILHLGDHANWCSEVDTLFKEQVDYIAKKCSAIDIIFIPIAKGSGARPLSITEGARYLINKLNANVVFPMHGGGREYLYKEFAEDIKASIADSKLVCAEVPGDKWSVSLDKNHVLINSN